MFQEIANKMVEKSSINMSVYFDGNEMKVMVVPKMVGEKDAENNIKPFTISGTPQEIDENFIGAFDTFIEVINEYNTNMDEIKKMLEQSKKNVVKKASIASTRTKGDMNEEQATMLAKSEGDSTKIELALKIASLKTLKQAFIDCQKRETLNLIAKEIESITGKKIDEMKIKNVGMNDKQITLPIA